MVKDSLLPVETLGASQEGTLIIEQFLMANYRFRRNILNGKVEFAVLPKADNKAEGNTVETVSSTKSTRMWRITKWCHSGQHEDDGRDDGRDMGEIGNISPVLTPFA